MRLLSLANRLFVQNLTQANKKENTQTCPHHRFFVIEIHDNHFLAQSASNVKSVLLTGGNRTMVAAATIVIMAAPDGQRISIFPLVCPDKTWSVSFPAPDI